MEITQSTFSPHPTVSATCWQTSRRRAASAALGAAGSGSTSTYREARALGAATTTAGEKGHKSTGESPEVGTREVCPTPPVDTTPSPAHIYLTLQKVMSNVLCSPSQEGSEPFRGAPSSACAKAMDWKPEALPKKRCCAWRQPVPQYPC